MHSEILDKRFTKAYKDSVSIKKKLCKSRRFLLEDLRVLSQKLRMFQQNAGQCVVQNVPRNPAFDVCVEKEFEEARINVVAERSHHPTARAVLSSENLLTIKIKKIKTKLAQVKLPYVLFVRWQAWIRH